MKRRTMDLRLEQRQQQQQQQQPHYKIYVKMMKTVALDVNCTDTVDQIKSKIGAIEGIDKSQQALFFAGSPLEDGHTLADYNIMTNSSVDLYVDGMQISVKIPSIGEIMKLNVRKSNSVSDVKAAIEEKGGIPLDEQVLLYAGRQLEDHQILSQCGITNGGTLHVLVCPTDKLLRISVKVEGQKTVNLDVKCWYTVADVKLMIENLEGLPACTQILMRTKAGFIETLKDTDTLQSQHIRNNDVLMSYRSIQFFIKTWEGKTLTLSMRTCDTIYEVMNKIEERLQIKEGIYYLQYRGRVLSPGDTLHKSKVSSNSTVDIRLRNSGK